MTVYAAKELKNWDVDTPDPEGGSMDTRQTYCIVASTRTLVSSVESFYR